MSRQEIIQWINQVTNCQLTKLEQLGSGNIYCQILDAAYPQKVPLHKVKWNAYVQIDFLYNFKILQNSFQKLYVKKTIDIQKLAKAKYQDNLQFIQWMKKFLEDKIKDNSPYDALARRGNNQIYLLFGDKKPIQIKNVSNGSTLPQKQNKALKQVKLSNNINENTSLVIDLKKFTSNASNTQRVMLLPEKDHKKTTKNVEIPSKQVKKAQKQNLNEQFQKTKKVKKNKLQVITKSKQLLFLKNETKHLEQQQCF